MTQSFSDVEPVGSSRKGVETEDNMHTVLLDSVVGDGSEVNLLVTMMQPRPPDIEPCSVGGGNTQGVDTYGCELVNVGGGDKSRVVVLESDSTSFLSNSLTEGPLVGNAGSATAGKETGSQGVLDSQPSAYWRKACQRLAGLRQLGSARAYRC